MPDSDKVIKGLQCIIDGTVRCESCGYAIDKHGHHSCQQNAKIGHWILDPDGMDWNIPAWRCSECGNRNYGLPTIDCDETNIYLFAGSKYCPNCGAKMEGR